MTDKTLLLLETFNLKKYLDTETMYLSSGEVKKLELLRLILEQKKFWLLDEPYNHLDDLSIEILNQTFVDHANNDGIILFASHYNPLINNLEILVKSFTSINKLNFLKIVQILKLTLTYSCFVLKICSLALDLKIKQQNLKLLLRKQA